MKAVILLVLLAFSGSGFSQAETRVAQLEGLIGDEERFRIYDSVKGFGPTEASLTNAFLKLAGSLEMMGKPEDYIRHIHAEEKRLAVKYKQATGQEAPNMIPSYLTEEYSEKLIATWNRLAPKLGLEELMKENGRRMVNGFSGSWNRGTIVIAILNEHQQRVLDDPAGGENVGYEEMKASLIKGLKLDQENPDLEGTSDSRGSAIIYARAIQNSFKRLFERIDKGVPPDQAEKIKGVISTMVEDLGRLIHAEFQLGVLENYLEREAKAN